MKLLTDAEIDSHPLLSPLQQQICRALRDVAKREKRSFTMYDFAEIHLRATGNDYAVAQDDDTARATDQAHRHAALLFAYESLKAGPSVVTDTLEERLVLRDIELVSRGN